MQWQLDITRKRCTRIVPECEDSDTFTNLQWPYCLAESLLQGLRVSA